ncbi:MAG: glycosyltransferase family 4 protein [Candidatus Thorarchaeota archaeon]
MKALMVYRPPKIHFCHKTWADAIQIPIIDSTMIGTRLYRESFAQVSNLVNSFILDNVGNYIYPRIYKGPGLLFSEGFPPLDGIMRLRKRKWKIILLAVSSLVRYSKQNIERWSSKIDAIISVSKMVQNDYSKLIPSVPNLIVYPFPVNGCHDRHDNKIISPITDIIFVGRLEESKGVDLLFKMVQQKNFDLPLKINIVGKGPLYNSFRKFANTNVRKFSLLGFRDPRPFLKFGQIYLHPAKYDPFPVSVLEAMTFGLIPIVSKKTGTKEVVRKIDTKLIVDANPDSIVNALEYVFNLSDEKRFSYGLKAAKYARDFSRKYSISAFRNAANWLAKRFENMEL